MANTIEILVESVRLADAALAAGRDAIHLFHCVDGLLRRHSAITLTTAQHNHLAAGHRIIVLDRYGNQFIIG